MPASPTRPHLSPAPCRRLPAFKSGALQRHTAPVSLFRLSLSCQTSPDPLPAQGRELLRRSNHKLQTLSSGYMPSPRGGSHPFWRLFASPTIQCHITDITPYKQMLSSAFRSALAQPSPHPSVPTLSAHSQLSSLAAPKTKLRPDLIPSLSGCMPSPRGPSVCTYPPPWMNFSFWSHAVGTQPVFKSGRSEG
jgi:hypothetical protein